MYVLLNDEADVMACQRDGYDRLKQFVEKIVEGGQWPIEWHMFPPLGESYPLKSGDTVADGVIDPDCGVEYKILYVEEI